MSESDREKGPEESEYERGDFICPECGSEELDNLILVSSDPSPDDPWSSVLQYLYCARCKSCIPAHIGERWNGMSKEQAIKEWQDKYREGGLYKNRKKSGIPFF